MIVMQPVLFLLCCLVVLADLSLQVVTVATDETDGFKRFMESAKHHNINVEVWSLISVAMMMPKYNYTEIM